LSAKDINATANGEVNQSDTGAIFNPARGRARV